MNNHHLSKIVIKFTVVNYYYIGMYFPPVLYTVGRTEPNLDDLGLTFQDLNVNVEELSDYVHNVDPLPFVTEVPKFPVPKESLLVFPKPNSRELLEREEHVDEYLPPMHPDWDGMSAAVASVTTKHTSLACILQFDNVWEVLI